MRQTPTKGPFSDPSIFNCLQLSRFMIHCWAVTRVKKLFFAKIKGVQHRDLMVDLEIRRRSISEIFFALKSGSCKPRDDTQL
jgi:hypothetical protein